MTISQNSPLTQNQRDNLNIGIYLCGRPYGASLDDVLQAALGYNPNGNYPANSFEMRAFRETSNKLRIRS